MIGDSHTLVAHKIFIERRNSFSLCEAKLIKGCMQWHLGKPTCNQYKSQLEKIFCTIPESSDLLLAIGEIDCRLDSGVIKYQKASPESKTIEIVERTICSYLDYIEELNSGTKHRIMQQGIPCPNVPRRNYSQTEINKLVYVVKVFNNELRNGCKERGFDFLDVHKLTDRGDGFSSGVWHMDSIHLSPDAFLEAWKRHEAI